LWQTLCLFPLARVAGEPWTERWWMSLRQCIEHSGPVLIKFFQWASTRRDLFSAAFCDFFGKMHSHNIPHSWAHSQGKLAEAFGPHWKDHLSLDPEAIGVGCVAQVLCLHGSSLLFPPSFFDLSKSYLF
jgi:aarF domain-containing kinase